MKLLKNIIDLKNALMFGVKLIYWIGFTCGVFATLIVKLIINLL